MIRNSCWRARLPWFVTAIAFGLGVSAGKGDDKLRVFPPNKQAASLLRSHLRGQVHKALDNRLRRYEAVKTPEQIASYQKRLKADLIRQLGGLPPRTPLRAKVVGKLEGKKFRVEKILFESRPGFFVTGTLFLPDGTGPFPAVLHPCGHTENGKAADSYQRASILLAQNGMACFCFDPIGQGERKQLLKKDVDPPAGRFVSTSEHLLEGVHPILLGQNIATYMIWDGIRAIDYLQSRSDIDSRRIGCTGNSGGGNMTSMLMAIDDRIACAAPGCFMTTTRRKNDSPGPGDAEQNIFGQTRLGIDHPDFMLIRAPRPTLICAATRDFVPIEGTWLAYRQAKRWYTRLGAGEQVDLVETDNRHGFTRPLREAVARWMSRWLLGRDRVIKEGSIRVFTERDLRCTPTGQVILMKGARTVFDLYRSRAEALREQRAERKLSARELRSTIRRLNAVRPLDKLLSSKRTRRVGPPVAREGYQIQRFVVYSADGFPLPALAFRPARPNGRRVLYLDGKGKAAATAAGGVVDRLAKGGALVLAVDLTGIGETETKAWRYTRMAHLIGNNAAEFYVAYMLGRSFVGIRAEDTLMAASFLKSVSLKSETADNRLVELIATGEACIPALHAATLEEHMFHRVMLRDAPVSWQSLFTQPVTHNRLMNTVHGALRYYDLPDLRKLLGGKLTAN